MSTIYIKAAENNAACKVKNFKDVTIVIDYKQSICYMSFDVINTGAQAFRQIEIILPFCCDYISDIRTENIEDKHCSEVSNSKCSKLLLTMWSPLEVNNSISVKLGFKVVLLEAPVEMYVHFFNLNLINQKSIANPPVICTKTMKLYIILPKSFEKVEMSDPANRYKTKNISDANTDISNLISDIKTFFKNDKMFKRNHEIFEWTNKKLSDLEETIEPANEKRLIQFEFREKDSFHKFGFDCSYKRIFRLISIISLILAIISILTNNDKLDTREGDRNANTCVRDN